MHTVRVVCASAVPSVASWFSNDADPPRCSVQLHFGANKYATKVSDPTHSPIFEQVFDLQNVGPQDSIEVVLFQHAGKWIDDKKAIGGTEIKVKDLFGRSQESLVMFDSDERIVLGENGEVCQVHLTMGEAAAKEGCCPRTPHRDDSVMNAMIITRGTRGDVQPFIALARGLANCLGWTVTICTEMNCKSFVKDNADVEKGAVKFLPSGGNTPAYINKVLSRWAIRSKSELMQAVMLARSEMEFFDSARAMVYWARQLSPDVLIYGFTMPHVAIMISELQQIPIIGFILQPHVIPSSELPAVEPLKKGPLLCGKTDVVSHDMQACLKMVHDGGLGRINRIRTAFGLLPMRMNSLQALVQENMPMIIPINQFCFGRHPADWSANTVFTDFIFLRKQSPPAVPRPFLESDEKAPNAALLGKDFVDFIQQAKDAGAPIVLMAFSSMPVPRQSILEMAMKIIQECPQSPRVIALVGMELKVPLKSAFMNNVNQLKQKHLLLEASGAPFDVLFPLMSCVIIHGGLGTTAEALRAGVPIIVTGVLLMDQRFWGKRVAELELGPGPVFIDHFGPVCVPHVSRVLSEPYVLRARQVAKLAAGRTDDGVEENALMVQKMLQEHPGPWKTEPGKMKCHCTKLCSVM